MDFPMAPGRTPRPWQIAAVNAAREALKTHQSVMLAAATGTGKGDLLAGLAVMMARRGRRILCLAHRKELIDDVAGRVRRVVGAPDVGVVMAGRNEMLNPIVVASVQSLTKKRRAQLGHVDAVITDEGHHAVAPQWRAVYEAVEAVNPAWKHILLSATPFRAGPDGSTLGLGDVVDAMPFEYPIHEAIEAGDLVPLRAFAVPTEVKIEGVRTSAKTGDFVEEDLAKALDLDARNDLVVRTYLERAKGLPALVFCASIEHSEHMAEAFVRAGVKARAVWGTMPDRDRDGIISLFRERPDVLPVLTSAQLIFEGFDAPRTAVILKARPTRSRVVFVQMLGRGLRTYGIPHGLETPEEKRAAIASSAKPECLFFDFVDNGCELDLASVSDLSESAQTCRTGRPLGPGDRVMRRYHDDWGVGIVDEVRPGLNYDEATVDWPASKVHPEGACSAHPVVELRRAPILKQGEDDEVAPVEIQASATAQVYEIVLLPGQRPDDPDAIGWYEHNGTWTVGGWKEGLGRIRMHVRRNPTSSKFDVWSLRPPLAHEIEQGRPKDEDVCTLRETKDSRNTAIAWANEYLRSNGAVVAPVNADWKADPATSGQAGVLRKLGLRRDTSSMSRGQASALIDAVSADRAVGDVLDPRRKQRREWVQRQLRGGRHGATQMALGAK